MTLERWHPLQELELMKKEMDRIWHDVFSATGPAVDVSRKRVGAQEGAATPAIDIIDREKEIVIRAEMPGVKREDVSVSLEESTLSIKGEIKEEAEKEGGKYTYSERKYRCFARSLNLPLKIKPEDIKAALKDGLLYIRLPKAVEEQPKKIKIDIT